MSNHYPHSNSRFHDPRQQHHNHTPYRPDRHSPRLNQRDSRPGRSDHHPPFPPPNQDLPYQNPHCHRRREHPRSRRDSSGYGGTPSSRSPERATPVMGRDLPPLSWHSRNTPPPYPPHRSECYPNELRDSDPFPPKSSAQSNSYKGGCPYAFAATCAPRRKQTNRNANNQPQRHVPDDDEARDALSLRNKANSTNHGPVKSKYSSQSPVRPVNPLPMPSSSIPPVTTKQTQPNHSLSNQRNPSPSHTGPDSLFNGFLSSFRFDNKPALQERRHARSLSCEKVVRPHDKLSLNSSNSRGVSASLGYSAIAPPIEAASADVQSVPQIRSEQQNGRFPLSNEGSHRIQAKIDQNTLKGANTANNHQNQETRSIESIFKKKSRPVPKVPDVNVTDGPTPMHFQQDLPISAQSKQEVKEVVTGSGTGKTIAKLPELRSAPAPIRSSTIEDTPQKRAAGAALLRAGQADCEEVKLVTKSQPSRNTSSHTDTPPFDSEPHRAKNAGEKECRAALKTCATSVSMAQPADQHGGPSNRKRETKPDVDNHNRSTQSSSEEGERQNAKSTKRRGTDVQESCRVAAKRPRPEVLPEPVSVEDPVRLRRSQRFPQPKTNKTWEITKFEADRVQNLFQAQLRSQPMLLRISFLGISDGDLRSTLDIYKSGMNLPEPDYRSLEVNNNRIRCITNEICTSISALRVSSLNLSCNMLTTLGDKLGLCSKLKFLNLSRNRLSCLPQELCDLTNLEVLNLSGNNIAMLPSGLCRLKKLEILSLARNKLEVLPEDVAEEGAALTGLDISHNPGFHFFPSCTEHWTKLLVLHIPDTEMYRSLSRREHRLRPSALLKELAGKNQDMRVARRSALRSQSGFIRR